jgi:hypothetical protein
MDPAKVVRSPQVLPLLAEGVRQSREAAHLHSDGEILALNVVCPQGLPHGKHFPWYNIDMTLQKAKSEAAAV